MSWTRTLATGSGALEFRLQIEGYEHEWVTNSSMAGATSDTPARTRCVGLLREGIILDEHGDLRGGKLKLGSMSLKIADIDGRATLSFSRKPTKTAWLTTTATTSATNIAVTSTSGWATSDVLHIGTEAMDVTAVVDGTNFTVTRAAWSTIAQKHWTEDGEHLRSPMVTNYPQMMEGRRARLYVYGGGDSMTGAGTLIWLGIVSTEPVLTDGVHWEIAIDPLTRILQGDIGEDLEEPVTPRGIYYPWNAPLWLQFYLMASAAKSLSGATSIVTVRLTGFYATQEAFVDALNVKLAAAGVTAWDTTIFARSDGPEGWSLVATTDASPLYVLVLCKSFVDLGTGFTMTPPESSAGFGAWLDPTDGLVEETTFTGTQSYEIRFSAPVPRGRWGSNTTLYTDIYGDSSAIATAPSNRVYVGGAIAIDDDMTAVQIEWPDGGTQEHGLDTGLDDATARYVYVQFPATGYDETATRSSAYAAPDLPRMKFGRSYTAATGGSLYDFVQEIINDSPDYANIGGVPFLTDADVDIGSIQTAVGRAASGRAFLTNRRFLAFGAMSLEDWIAEECKLLGLYPCLTSGGELTFRKLRLPVVTDVAAGDIDSSSVLVDGGFPAYERNPYGMVNTVIIRTGYDPVEGDHKGHTYVVRDVTAFGINKSPRVTEIAPFSSAAVDEETVTIDQIRSVADPILAIFGRPYSTVSVEVPLTMFGVLLGDTLHVVSAHLPDTDDGTRGWTTAKAGLVLGRRWDLAAGRGVLTLLVHDQQISGYAPQMRITGDTINDPGTNVDHTLTVTGSDVDGTANAYIPSGTDATDWFAVGDKIRVVEWDATVPTTAKGTVTAVTATTVRVTFTAGTTAGFDDPAFMLGFDSANTGSYATGQKAFCSIAGTDGLIDYPSDARSARVFA